MTTGLHALWASKQHLCHFHGQKFHFWTAKTGEEEDLKLQKLVDLFGPCWWSVLVFFDLILVQQHLCCIVVKSAWLAKCLIFECTFVHVGQVHGIVSYNCLFTHQNSSISEMVRWEDFHVLVDLAWNDPYDRAATNIITKIRKFRDLRTCQKWP